MIGMYLKIALRNLRRHKGYSFLNITGLAIGLAASSLILLYVHFELSFDDYHSKADRIYRLYKRDPGNVFLGTDYFAVTPAPLGKALEADFPEVESSVKIKSGGGLVRVDEKPYVEKEVYYVEPSLFTIFDFPFVRGNPATALNEPFTAVVSEAIAGKYFGSEDPLGKVIRLADKYDVRITGVMKDVPANSQFAPAILSAFATYESTLKSKNNLNWGNSSYYQYVLLRKGADVAAVQAKMPAFVNKYMGELFKKWKSKEPTNFYLQPLADVHLHSSFINFGNGRENDINTIRILSVLALVILLTAGINYMNLATARATLRAKEVGMRKIVGARRFELVRQYVGESLVYTGIAACFALILVELALPAFSRLIDTELDTSLLTSTRILGGYVIVVLLLGLFSGSYPAFVLAAYQPVRVLKGLAHGRERSKLRDVLVVSQFAASIALIICTGVILEQLHFIRTTNPGFNRDHIITLKMRGEAATKNASLIKQRLLQNSNIASVSSTSYLPIEIGSEVSLEGRDPKGNEVRTQSYILDADDDFLKTYEASLKQGRYFSGDLPGDSVMNFVVNEAFVKEFGWDDPIGKTFQYNDKPATVIGVVKDFHLHSLHDPIAPLFIMKRDPDYGYLGIRVRPGDVSGTIAYIKETWSAFVKDYPVEYSFLDDNFNEMYKSEERLGTIVSSFTILAIVVASLGLFGLAAFITEQRKKEIGVRRVLGASVAAVVTLLSREFLILVAVANVIAWPVAWFLMKSWLDAFAYRISPGVGLFALAGVAAVLVAVLAVSYQSIRAAAANPVEALRYE